MQNVFSLFTFTLALESLNNEKSFTKPSLLIKKTYCKIAEPFLYYFFAYASIFAKWKPYLKIRQMMNKLKGQCHE